ncbi:MAG: TetR family transcriptional regulator [Gammaproteobacteria bacterium]|nr:TetR family transcriptional regulator [Gammaproteobacteria bacterium]NIM72792.1 TetR family transcriptional regulator [Gammaproteobacteria bacterium]NIN38249.1 TetR family transcriptional regulator [Gammaproteobacteria bacterium]NIO24540.1 TetR family transcriptional regulator [Gammaproteobacteria bacterium]NIO65149.1 TetR family transcriptional regulator [Gammaproteobacteria bacterium]
MPVAAPAGTPRHDNRRRDVLDAAAGLISRHGYHATSMRDIARATGMLPGSIYYHFASKDALLVAVYAEGVQRIAGRVDRVVAAQTTPLKRLEAACVAHLEMLLADSDYAQVVVRVLPQDVPAASARLTALRDDYEARFRRLIAALGLPRARRRYARLTLLGALNAAQSWYRPGGDAPARIARGILACLREPLEAAKR